VKRGKKLPQKALYSHIQIPLTATFNKTRCDVQRNLEQAGIAPALHEFGKAEEKSRHTKGETIASTQQ
jgi:hypothetical protein